jgi:hypothetical protein
MSCPVCGKANPANAHYCMYCGAPLEDRTSSDFTASEKKGPKPTFQAFWISLGLSLLVSFILILVFHLPIFVMGLFLPFIWQLRPQRRI